MTLLTTKDDRKTKEYLIEFENFIFISIVFFIISTATLEEMQILEKISPDAMVFLQTHKRVWPATQRDALFWSHMRQITDNKDEGALDTWVVCNNSVDHESFPVSLQIYNICFQLTFKNKSLLDELISIF